MTRIVIQSKVPAGYYWLSGNNENQFAFEHIARAFRDSFSEDVMGFEGDSTIDNYVVMKMSSDRAKSLTKQGDKDDEHILFDVFNYSMSGQKLKYEDSAVLVDTRGKHINYSDYVKWRTRNALGKIIDGSLHPNGFALEARIYWPNSISKPVLPLHAREIFYIQGSGKFVASYMGDLPAEFANKRVIDLGKKIF